MRPVVFLLLAFVVTSLSALAQTTYKVEVEPRSISLKFLSHDERVITATASAGGIQLYENRSTCLKPIDQLPLVQARVLSEHGNTMQVRVKSETYKTGGCILVFGNSRATASVHVRVHD